MNGELVGQWTAKPTGPNEFSYAQAWLDSPSVRPLSLSMPLRPPQQPYRGAVVRAFFDNLLPDNEQIRQRIQARYGTASTEPFQLLAEIGRDCIGAVQLLPEGRQPDDLKRIDGEPVSDDEIEGLLVNAVAPGRLQDEDDFRISLAGTQEKTAFLHHKGRWFKPKGSTPTTHIFKLPMGMMGAAGIDLSTSVENEWLCAQILREYGISIARCERAQFGNQRVLVVERFDRRLASDKNWIVRLPQEDMCQATGTPSAQRYESDGGPGIRTIMDLLLGSDNPEADRQDFFRTQLLFWMLCAIDGHAKNFSVFIEAGGGYRLTPRYDVLSAYPFLGHAANRLPRERARMAMAWLGVNRHYRWHEIMRRHIEETARRCGLGETVKGILSGLIEATPRVTETVSKLLPQNFPAHLSEPILKGLHDAADRLAREAAL
jgi:serine/threonine-protein kinase HipA